MKTRETLVDNVYRKCLDAFKGDTSRISIDDQQRKRHSYLVSYHEPHLPDIVAFPETVEEVSNIHKICYQYEFPIIPYGRATSLEGHVSPLKGGLILSLTKMNKVLQFNKEDMDITIQSGVTREQLNQYLEQFGFFFPVDPGANATLGGMVSTRASGTNTIKYQTMRENVLRLKVVSPEGKVFKTGTRAKKSAAGYDLTRLFIGSEGTLGTIVEITLKVYIIPKSIAAAICSFTTIQDAAKTVIQLIQKNVAVARVEILDEMAMKAVNLNFELEYKEVPTLFFEFQGNNDNFVKYDAQIVQELCKNNGGSDFQWEIEEEKRNILWRARHKAYYATLALKPGSKALTTDVCVPISKFADVIVATKKDFDATGITYTLVGHSGDGNFHLIICLDEPTNHQQLKIVNEAYDRLIHHALAVDGTCTGEHGIGSGKIKYLLFELGPDAVRMMKTIKQAIDPKNIMNPGKVLPSEEEIIKFEQMHKRGVHSKL